ncbi:MAG: glycosyltransferase family 39 protein [Armatimonadetes bacterium]|nr:glycosyltransferase family 39 protein [Armatimonadota bacterium]
MKGPRRELLPKLALAAVIAAYVVLAGASSLATRLKYGPDEPAHFVYVHEIARFRMPTLSHEVTPNALTRRSHEAHQPPLYYILSAVPYAIASKLGAGVDLTWRILRLCTIIFGAGWIYFLYRLAREFVGGSRYRAVLAAACVGLLPSSVYIGGVVNNDALSAVVFTAAMWLIVRTIRRSEVTLRDAVLIGIISGLAILTKAQGLFLLPTAVVSGLLIVRRSRHSAATTFINTGIALVTALGIGGIWFIRNIVVFGSPLIQSLYNPGPGWSLSAVAIVTQQLFNFFWTPFWLLNVFVDSSCYFRMLFALCFLAVAGVGLHLAASQKGERRSLADRIEAWALLALPAILIYLFLLRHTLVVDKGALQQGRLLLPAAGLLGASIVVGFGAFLRIPLLRAALGVLTVLGLVFADITVVRAIVAFYRIY